MRGYWLFLLFILFCLKGQLSTPPCHGNPLNAKRCVSTSRRRPANTERTDFKWEWLRAAGAGLEGPPGPRAPAASWAAGSCGTDPGACWLLLRSHRPTAGGAATPAPSPGRFLPSLRVAPPRSAAPACVLRAHYTHGVTGPHRLPHGARHPRGALSASSSRHGSHLRGWRAPSPRDVPLRPQDQRAARVSREGGDARPAAAPLGPGSGAQRARASPLCPNKGGRHRGTRTPTRRAGSLLRRLPTTRAPIRCRNRGALNAPRPPPPPSGEATGLGRGLKSLWQVGWPGGDRRAFLTERVPGLAPQTES